jgi:hypothetical protein
MMPKMIQVWEAVNGQLVMRTCDNDPSYPDGLQWGQSEMFSLSTGKFEYL